MEYNLQKTIEPNLKMHMCPSSSNPRLTAYPANDFINPGIGNISKLYSFYVPIHTQSFKHEIKKNGEENLKTDQLGGGDVDILQKTESDETVLQKLNEKKRKLLGDAVFESFMHPKPFKTKKIELQTETEKQQKNSKPKSEKIGKGSKNLSKKPQSHKFQFY
jgi:hypothetical protein